MPSSIQISLHSIPSAPSTPTSFESTCDSFASPSLGRGPKVLNGRLVKSKPRQPTQSTSSRTLPPSTLSSPSLLAEGKKEQRENQNDYDDDHHNNDNDNENVHANSNNHVNATKEPQKHSKHSKDTRDKEVKPEKPASGNKIWKLMKRISTGGLRDKYALHTPSFSMSGQSGKALAARGVVDTAAAGGGTSSGIGGSSRSLSRAAQLRVTKLSNYSEESLSLSHQSHGSYGSLVASSSHTSHASHGESCAGPALLASTFNTFNHDHEPPPVPAIPKDLQNHHHLQTPNVLLPPSVASSPSSPASSEPGSNMSRKHHRRDRDNRSASSPIPSIPSPLSPGQFSPASTNYSSSPPPQTPSPSPSAPSKHRILSRISSMGLLRRKPSIASGLALSLGFGTPATGTAGTPEKAEKSGKNEKMKNNEKTENNEATNAEAAVAQGELAVHEVPALFTIPTIPSTPPDYSSMTASKVSKPKSTKYSISCIPIPSIPPMPSMSIIASSTPSTPTKSTTTAQISSISFSSSSSRPGTGKTTLSQSSSAASSPRLSLDSRSRSHSRSMGILATRSRSNSLDSLDSLGRRHNHHINHVHTTPTGNKKSNSNHHQDRDNHQNNNHNHNVPVHSTTTDITITNSNNSDYPYPLDKHIVPPLELSATLSGEDDDNKWGVEHVLSGEDFSVTATSSTFVSSPADDQSGNGSLSYPSPHSSLGRRDGDAGLGPKRVNRSTGSLLLKDKLEDSNMIGGVNKREEKTVMVDKWERLLERVEKWDKSELDRLDGLRSKSVEPWTIARSPEPEELPSLPVPPRKRTKEKESRREKESKEEKWERSASVDIPASPVSSSPIYRGRAMDDIPTPSTFGRVMGKQIGAEGSMEEKRHSSSSPIQGRASFSVVGDDGRDSRKKNGRDRPRKRRSLSAVRSASSSKDGPSHTATHSWTKSLSSPTRRKNSEDAGDIAAVVLTTSTPPVPVAAAAATPPRALGTLFRKLSFSGSSLASGTEKRRNKSPKRPSTASSISSAKARSVSISSGGKSGFFWNGGNGDSNKQGELDSLSSLPQPRRLLRKTSLLKGRSHTGNQDKDAMQDKPPTVPLASRMRRPRTADSSSTSNTNGTLTEKEKRERWEYLLERSEKAGGTIHLRANGEGLLSDRMRMSMASTANSEVTGVQVGVQEGDY